MPLVEESGGDPKVFGLLGDGSLLQVLLYDILIRIDLRSIDGIGSIGNR